MSFYAMYNTIIIIMYTLILRANLFDCDLIWPDESYGKCVYYSCEKFPYSVYMNVNDPLQHYHALMFCEQYVFGNNNPQLIIYV